VLAAGSYAVGGDDQQAGAQLLQTGAGMLGGEIFKKAWDRDG
jgi:hypothetical protein